MFKLFCAYLFKVRGWKFESKVPDELRSFVLIGAPHTANYDFLSAMAISYFLKRNAKFVIKKEWLKFPLSLFFNPMGAVGLDRNAIRNSKTLSSTDLMAELFQGQQEFVLMLSPEGTRKANTTWKTGFYYIAQKANVPIVLGYADFKTKTIGAGLVIYPTNFEQDMASIMEFFSPMVGKVPGNFALDHRFSSK